MVDEAPVLSLESALAKTEADADVALRAAASVTTALKKVRGAARAGTLRDLEIALTNAEQSLDALRQRVIAAKTGWDFDGQAYFAGGAFPHELRSAAERANVTIYELDDRLYCYPSLIRVLAGDRAVMIDKSRDRAIRPSVLAARLKALQQRPARFKPDAFLRSLFEAYVVQVKGMGKHVNEGAGVKLIDVYNLLTMLPGQSREYSLQEFGRDLYLLDQSGETATSGDYTVHFTASTATRGAQRGLIRIITQRGDEKVYAGIAFTKVG